MAGDLNSVQEMGNFATLRNFAGCEILQVVKISQHCEILQVAKSYKLCSSFLMGSDLQR